MDFYIAKQTKIVYNGKCGNFFEDVILFKRVTFS